jgi:phosphoglycerol transferase MdoB-like AlkP superfamily enzyme
VGLTSPWKKQKKQKECKKQKKTTSAKKEKNNIGTQSQELQNNIITTTLQVATILTSTFLCLV